MKYGPNKEWDEHRISTAPPEPGHNSRGRGRKIAVVGAAIMVGLATAKACESSSDDNSLEYIPQQYSSAEMYLDDEEPQEPAADLSMRSPSNIPVLPLAPMVELATE